MATDSDIPGSAPGVPESSSTTFSLFGELRAWSTQLQEWERLALRVLLEKGTVDEDDLSAIYQVFLINSDLAAPEDERRSHDLSLERIPETAEPETRVGLMRITHVEGVNALVSGHYIDVGADLTVVYGPNGSGKSGYARILKDSCFTRSEDKRILGNVYVAEGETPTPSAVLTVAVNGDEEDLGWQPGVPLPLLRDYFAVFDTSCTRVNIDEQNVFVTPYGFDVFPDLVTVSRQIRDVLQQETAQRTPDTEGLAPKEGTSRISELLAALSKDTPIEELERLAAFGGEEKKRLLAVQKEIEELQKRDPAATIKQLETLRKDLDLIRQECEAVSTGLNFEAVKGLRATASQLERLQTMADAVSATQFAGEAVQPVGSETWVQLVRAALAFSAEAYPDLGYPADVEDVRCVLCQQPLSAQVKSRLQRFVEFVQSDVKQKAEKKRAELEAAYANVRGLDLGFFSPEAACRRSLQDDDPRLAERIDVFVAQARARRDGILRAGTDEEWKAVEALPDALQTAVSKKIASLGPQVTKLKETDAAEELSTLEAEQQLLRHRQHLSTMIDGVKKAVKDLKWTAAATDAKNAISTRHITEKQKALVKELIAKSFLPELQKECRRLGAVVPLDIRVVGSLGETTRRLSLNGASSPDRPSDVLSEGEQRAVAIADFLTEVGLAGNAAGLIFDDPVCSLDNERKQKIAVRFVEEATRKQVLVFTHDVFFAHHLVAAAEDKAVDYVLHTMSRGTTDGRPGHVDDVVFPDKPSERRALRKAEECLEEAQAACAEDREEKLQVGCGFLRTAYEDFVQRELFGDIIRRWDERIGYRLSDVYFDEDIAQRAQTRMEFLSRYIDAHSHSLGFPERPLSVDLLADELRLFAEVKSDYRSRRKKKREGKKRNESN